jgi:hypothetical protein
MDQGARDPSLAEGAGRVILNTGVHSEGACHG